MMTVQVDHGVYKATFTYTSESIAVNLVGERNQSLANYITLRKDVPRMDLLLSGIEAWSKELFTKVTEERGVASLPEDQTTRN